MSPTTDSSVWATIVLGTRPEIIKLAPLIRELGEQGIPFSVIHTGQHYSENLDTVFFEQLELPVPDHNLAVGSKSHGQQTGEMLTAIESILLEEEPEVVLVQGDTNSTLAGAIAACKLKCDLVHIEAGLRSYDREMPEELNRLVADHIGDYLLAPTKIAEENLLEEGIPSDRVTVTGNTVVDALYDHRELAEANSTVLTDHELEGNSYALMTAHRAENVDDPDRFSNILTGIGRFATKHDIEVIYPIHPRASDKLAKLEITPPDQIRLVGPQDYFDFLKLQSNARIVFTDSGGVQEEACILGVPCVTIRDNTERPETVAVGANKCAGTDPDEVVAVGDEMMDHTDDWDNPLGDGSAAKQIIDICFRSESGDT